MNKPVDDSHKLKGSFNKEIEMCYVLLENLPCVALILKKNSREIVFANAAARQVGAIVGKTCYQACLNRLDPCPFCLAPESWAANSPRQAEVEYLGKRYEASWIPIDKDSYVHYLFDVTERKKIEIDRDLAYTRFQRLVDSNIIGIVICDAQGNVREANSYYLNILGFSRQELDAGKLRWTEVTPSEWVDADKKAILELNNSGVCTPYEKEYFRKDGSRVSVLLYDTVLPGPEELILAVVMDISETKKVEKALQENEQRLARLVDTLPGFVYRCANDRNWTMEFLSDGCYKITGYTPEDLLQNKKLSYNDIVRADFREPLWEKWQYLLERKEIFEEEYPIITASGETRWVWERGRGIYSESGQLLALEGFITDISERKKAEEVMQQQMQELRRWNEVTLGREMRILELKREVNELMARLGEPKRYINENEA